MNPSHFRAGAYIFAAAVFLFTAYRLGFVESFHQVDDTSLVFIPQMQMPFSWSWVQTYFTPGNHIDFYPVRDISYWVDTYLLGAPISGEDGFLFRLHHLILLWCCTGLIYLILHRWLSFYGALFTAIFWMIHPYHAEMLLWISARKDLLALTWGLVATYLFLEPPEKKPLSTLRVIAIFSAYGMSLLSKATLAGLPLAVALSMTLFHKKAFDRSRYLCLFVTGLAGMGWAIYQGWFYENYNDMRLYYPFSDRLRGSVTALGRMLSGLVWIDSNAVDVENWGNWIELNRAYFPVGVLFWAVTSALGLWGLINKKWKIIITLAIFFSTYLPISALLFPHRNFYSVRYLEAPLLGLLLCGTCFGQKFINAKNLSRLKRNFFTGFCSLVLLVLIAATVRESHHWESALTVIQKARGLSPLNFSLMQFEIEEWLNLKRWGRIDANGLSRLKNLRANIANECPTTLPLSPMGSLCWDYWAHSENPFGESNLEKRKKLLEQEMIGKMRILQDFKNLNSHRAKKAEYTLNFDRYFAQQSRDLSVFPQWLQDNPGRLATPQLRTSKIISLCMMGQTADAGRLRDHYSQEGLLSYRWFTNSIGYWSPEIKDTLKKCGILDSKRWSL